LNLSQTKIKGILSYLCYRVFVAADDTRIAVMTLCDRADIPDEELDGWEDAKYQGDTVAIPYDVAVVGGEWDSTKNLTETPTG